MSTSIPNVRFKRSAHGRYLLARLGVDVGIGATSVASLVSVVIVVFFSGRGPIRERHGLADARTPLYFTGWKRGGGTLIANRQSSRLRAEAQSTAG